MGKENREKIKILLVQICNRNLGDAIIADNVRFLLKKAFPFYDRDCVNIIDYNIYTNDVSQIKYVDAIVFDGGGIIKYKAEHFDERLVKITDEAQKYGVPVFFNAVGVEGYDEDNSRCLEMKRVLNLDCVKMISVRDDVATMKSKYVTNPEVHISSVFDSAVFSNRTYTDIKHNKESDVIGLGIAREGLFTDYGIAEVDRSYLLNLWKDIINELDKRGFKWQIFTNGTDADEKFAEEVLQYVGHGSKLPLMTESQQLVRAICSFKGIIACRMHTNIVAYSYKIPSIGLVWSDKLKYWGEKIGYSERFVTKENLNAVYVVDRMAAALNKGCKGLKRREIKSSYKELKKFIRKFCILRQNKVYESRFENHLLAPALGTKFEKYKNMNCLSTFEESLQMGFNAVEFDLRVTQDNKPVLINGWNAESYRMLRVNPDDYGTDGMPLDEFRKCKYFSNYPTATLEEFFNKYKELSGKYSFKVIIDIGRPNKEKREVILTELKRAFEIQNIDKNNFIIRLQRKSDVESAKALDLQIEVMYYYPSIAERKNDFSPKKLINYCKAEGITRISMRAETYTNDVSKLLNKNEMQACVLSLTKLDDILNCIDRGAEFVGSGIYSPEYFRILTKYQYYSK